MREAEEESRRTIDTAVKDAQRTRLGIREKLDAMDHEKDSKLKQVAQQAEEVVEKEMKTVAAALEDEITRKKDFLDSRRDDLEKSAEEMLRETILGAAEGDR